MKTVAKVEKQKANDKTKFVFNFPQSRSRGHRRSHNDDVDVDSGSEVKLCHSNVATSGAAAISLK